LSALSLSHTHTYAHRDAGAERGQGPFRHPQVETLTLWPTGVSRSSETAPPPRTAKGTVGSWG
jgi:hypothetical protein